MSKKNNANPGLYKDGDRNHQGEGILQEEHRERMAQDRKHKPQEEDGKNFIPGEAPVGKKSEE